MKILVVDDEPTARAMLSMLLEDLGEVDEAEDGEEALARVSEAFQAARPYDLVCIDLSMPGLDGHALIERLRQIEEGVGQPERSRLIVISASRYSQDIVQAFKKQADGYLIKPVQLDKLEKLLREFSFLQAEKIA